MKSFFTIKENIQTEIVVKKSKFICSLFYVSSQDEAEEFIKKTKKKYFDAKHNCVAYRINDAGRLVEKSNDDGEPSGTAGAPMLNILQKNDLSNILVVVTRYFGGILLGTGGLVRAYSDSLLKAVDNSEKIEKIEGIEMLVNLEYANLENFKYYCKINQINITNVDYSEIIECKIELEDEKSKRILEDFENKNINLNGIKILSKKMINKSITK